MDVSVISTTIATTSSSSSSFPLDPGSPPHLHPGGSTQHFPSILLGVSSHSDNTTLTSSPLFSAKEIGFKDVRPDGPGEAVTLAQSVAESHLPGSRERAYWDQSSSGEDKQKPALTTETWDQPHPVVDALTASEFLLQWQLGSSSWFLITSVFEKHSLTETQT